MIKPEKSDKTATEVLEMANAISPLGEIRARKITHEIERQ
jgi:hypothetical protein